VISGGLLLRPPSLQKDHPEQEGDRETGFGWRRKASVGGVADFV